MNESMVPGRRVRTIPRLRPRTGTVVGPAPKEVDAVRRGTYEVRWDDGSTSFMWPTQVEEAD